jgi:Tol biopolymer transport system component/DNA-binding winged helix-turn-helix (wHTH) protein
MKALTSTQFKFGDFEIDASRRVLLKHGEPVALNSKTFDLLLTLVERRGEVLSKDELLDKVWAGQFVEEGNLKVQVSTLRKVFGEKRNENRFIATVPGRGYSFVAEFDDGEDIIIESHSSARIVVEEEIDDGQPPNRTPLPEHRSFATWIFTSRAAIALIAGLLILGTGSYLLFRRVTAGSIPFDKMSIKRLTSKGNIGTAAISPDGKLFVYTVVDLDQESLWLGNVDGGEPVEIRPPEHAIHTNLKFDPDESSLYFTASENFGNGALYRMPILGGAPEKLRDNFHDMTFAPDGKQFAFLRYDEKQAATVVLAADANGANEHQLATLPNNVGSDWHNCAWSPDGSMIAIAASVNPEDVRVFLLNIVDGSISPMADQSWRSIRAVSWLHDKSGAIISAVEKDSILPQLWFVSYPAGSVRRMTTDLSIYGFPTSADKGDSILTVATVNQSNIWIGAADNLADAKQVTFGSPGQEAGWNGLEWTADGRILYSAENSAGMSIWIMNPDGHGEKQVIPNGGLNYYPSVTDDGRYMVFESNRSGDYGVWRSDLNGENMVRLTGDTPAVRPFVSPDGKWVIYILNSAGQGELWRMSIDGADAQRLIEKGADWPQISPDSQSIACQLDVGGKTKLAIFPIDGGQPPKLFDIPRLANIRLGVHWTPDGRAVTYRDWADGIWRQSLDGGQREKLPGLPKEKLYSYGWSHDGREFAFARGSETRDVVLLQEAK